MSKNTNSRMLSELAFLTFRTVLSALTTTVSLRILFEYSWQQSALYGISMIGSFYVGQGIVSFLQRGRRQPVRQENEWH